MIENNEEEVDLFVRKARHCLITRFGRRPERADRWEVFQAISFVLREEVMLNWAATIRHFDEQKPRKLYYLSMEYMPGRILENNISRMHRHAFMRKVVKKLGYDYGNILFLEPDPGLGNGGLGRLASCFLDSLATFNYPVVSYGLRYQYGIFEQQIWDGVQVEKPDCWLLNENPWNLRQDRYAKSVKFDGVVHKRVNGNNETVLDVTDYEEVRAIPFDFPIIGFSSEVYFNVATLRLWSTKESPRNFHLQRYNAGQIGPAAENTALTDVLYPNDNNEIGKRIRLKQEFLLVSASLQDIISRHLELFPDLSNLAEKVRIQINDTHPTLVIPELIRQLTKHHSVSWQKSWEMTQEIVGYTNHTVLAEAMEEWNEERLSTLLPRQYFIIEQINQQLCESVRKRFPGDEARVQRMSIFNKGQIRMAHLAVYGSHKTNGVARLHGELLKTKFFKDFFEMFPDKFTYITNGVSQRRWLLHCNPLLTDFLVKRIGYDWLTDFPQIQRIRDFAGDFSSQQLFWDIRKMNKERLLKFLSERNPDRDMFGKPTYKDYSSIDTEAIFDMHIKRVHEYKRQLMNAIHLIMTYHDLLENIKSRPIKRVSIFAGKASAGYVLAKSVIRLICCLARTINNDPRINGKLQIIFVENYSVTAAEALIPAADLSEQISTVGLEASGTGNMKLAMNGALTICTRDGSNIEMHEAIKDPWFPFAFGIKAEDIPGIVAKGVYNPWDFYLKHSKIKRALDSLKDGSFAKNESEKEAFSDLFDSLLLGYRGERADRYYLLYDLFEYYETQKRVEQYFLDKDKWAECALHNIAGMGTFSSDYVINKYVRNVWELKQCPVDFSDLQDVKQMYVAAISG